MSGLSEQDMRILAFERRGWRSPGVKEQAIAFDPALVKRLRAQRARRQRMRSPRRSS
jgi:hypothetical protein